MNKHVFALDIGTQTVTGILLKKNEKTFNIIDYYVKAHEERAMLDGQIQDVVQVAKVITEVKEHLEEKHGPLLEVCVAAAGRALKTIQADFSININDRPITTEEEIKHLELSAVQQAQILLSKEYNNSFKDYHCVGYSVVHYKLDDEIIGSFIDQIGEQVTVEVIATFLPRIVVESLLAALERANLSMRALTLEPIAAIHVLIPESMRRLNVVLIDIGAGTSDIAISNDGTVVAYGMVPVAGDEITEAVSDHFLLDFKTAEIVKRTVVHDGFATVQDILGFDLEITSEQLTTTINDRVERLAQLLADKVIQLNAKSPQAVMLIGGGSQTPNIAEKLAANLQLPKNRVAVRGTDAISVLEKNELLPSGPDFVTPIGIAISASKNPLRYVTVYVNDKVTFMFKLKELTVGDCLIQAGIDVNEYYGKIGLASFITVNEEQITLRGEYGQLPQIMLNNEIATVDSLVQSEDHIIIRPGADGKSPTVSIEDILGKTNPMTIYINEKKWTLEPTYLANDKQVTQQYLLQDNDKIDVVFPSTIDELLQETGQTELQLESFYLYINEQKIQLNERKEQILLNGQPARTESPINDGDKLSIAKSEKITVRTLLDQLQRPDSYNIQVTFNDKPITLKRQLINIIRGDITLAEEDTLFSGDKLTLKEYEQKDFIFQDIFRYVDIDVSQFRSKYSLIRNDEEVSFHAPIRHGDRLMIKAE